MSLEITGAYLAARCLLRLLRMGNHTAVLVSMVGLVGAAACTGEITGGPEEVLLHLEVRAPDHVSGTADLGEMHVRFESTATEALAGYVVFELDQGSVAYGLSVPDNDLWSDGPGLALRTSDVTLLREVTRALTEEMGTDADRLGFAEMLLVSTTSYLAEAPVGYPIPSQTRAIQPVAPTDGALYAQGNDGIQCVKRNQLKTASWGWPGYSTTRNLLVNENGQCLGKCGDCGFGIGQAWTLDCLEHDACIEDAARQGLRVIGQSPIDYYCGDEWQQAEDDFLLGWVWPFNCRG